LTINAAVIPRDESTLLPLELSESVSGPVVAGTVVELLNSYTVIFLAAFLTTLLITPVVRRLAIELGVIDRPDQARKLHDYPVAYMGGVAVLAGLIVAIAVSYVWFDQTTVRFDRVPISVVIGMVAIAFTGLADDMWKLSPRIKIVGQLVAAAALAAQDIGVRVAAGVLYPFHEWIDSIIGTSELVWTLPMNLPLVGNELDLIYWSGTAIVAIFVLGACNSANLIDGLDGLLSGTVAMIALGLIMVSLMMAIFPAATGSEVAGSRLVLSFALLGAVLGFLPHNFNPASIFLGDCGSLLLGYMCVVIILMLGEHGQTHLVFAGLIIFGLPIMDTVLAIIRRVLAGVSLSAADDQHIHHQLKRGLGSVKRAVLAMWGISFLFMSMGVSLAALVMLSDLRVRVVYAIVLVIFGSIAVVAVKAARREALKRGITKALAMDSIVAPAGGETSGQTSGETPGQAIGESSRSGREIQIERSTPEKSR